MTSSTTKATPPSSSSSASCRRRRHSLLPSSPSPSPSVLPLRLVVLMPLLLMLLEAATEVCAAESDEDGEERGPNSSLAKEVERWVPMGLAGLFLFGFVGYCCYQVRGAARGRAEVEAEVDLELEGGRARMKMAPRLYGLSKGLSSSEDRLSPLHCPSTAGGKPTVANSCDITEVLGGTHINISNNSNSSNICRQAGRGTGRGPSTLPVDYSSDTADPSPRRRSGGDGGGGVVVVPDVVAVGGDDGGGGNDGNDVPGVVEQENQQPVLKREGRGEAGVWDEISSDEEDGKEGREQDNLQGEEEEVLGGGGGRGEGAEEYSWRQRG